MKITQVQVSAGRTFNHPYESYSNLRSHVHFSADLGDGESPEEAAKALQAKAEQLAEDHKRIMLKNLHDIEVMSQRNREIAQLERSIAKDQQRLEQARIEQNAVVMIDTYEPRPDREEY